MEPVIMDPTWALLTLVLTALLGMVCWLVLMILIESRAIRKNTKRIVCPLLFIVFMAWLFTLGDPRSSVNLEVLYYKSINYLPDTGFTKILKKGQGTSAVVTNTNAPVTVLTNK